MTHREEIDSFDIWYQYKIYFHYVSVQLKLKHNLTIVDSYKDKGGWGEPVKRYPALNCSIHKLWSNIQIQTFDEFLNDKNGMEDWYWKFKTEIL